MAHETKELNLPLLVVGPTDILRLRRELASLDDYLHQASLRQGGKESPKLPKTSRVLDDFAASNELNLLHAEERAVAADYLTKVESQSPVVTVSFAVEPSAAFINKVLSWLRQNIHPQLLLRIGLQPNIGAGCTLRTNNRQYDFSLRGHFADQRQLLISKLEAALKEPA